MINIVSKIAAILAIIIGLMTVNTGTRVLIGSFDPGYNTFIELIVYNVLMGILSVFSGWFIWKGNKIALSLSAIITIGHTAVLVSLITLFVDIVALQSIKAMTFRVVVWLIIFTIVYIQRNLKIRNSKDK